MTHPLYKCRELPVETDSSIEEALQDDPVARRVLSKSQSPFDGQLVGVRLNLNVLKRTGVAAHSIHRSCSKDGHTRGRGFYRGEVIAYAAVVTLKDAYFNVNQSMREAIAIGHIAKCPMASIDGLFIACPPPPSLPSFDGVEIRFNPKLHHLFVDEDGYAIQYASDVTILGHRAYARGDIRYYNTHTAPLKIGNAPSAVRFR